MKKLLFLVLSMVFLVGVVSGCGGDGKEDSGKEKTSVVYSLEAEAEQLDPTLNNYSRSSVVLQNLFRGLFKLDSDGKVVNAYCKDYTVDDSGTKYVFNLEKEGKWSDGSPLTAHDFEYSWKRVLDPSAESKATASLYYVKNGEAFSLGEATADEVGVKATDDYVLEVELENPTAYFLDLLCTTAYYPVKKELVEAEEAWTKSAETYVSTGPFMMKEISPKEKYVLEKNPNYIHADGVKLDELVIMFIESPEGELAAYKNGEIDVADNLSPEAIQEYIDTDEYKIVNRIGTYYFDFNTSREPFDDVRVRQALSLSIDRDVIIERILKTGNEPAYGFVPYGIQDTADNSKEYRETAGDLFSMDVEKAKELMKEAGYENGEGFPVIEFITLSSQRDADIAVTIQSMWKENLGVEIEINSFESKVYWDEHTAGNFDIARDGFTGSFPDPLALLDTLGWPKQETESRWKNDEYIALLQENKEISDQEKRMENAIAAEKIIVEDMPVIPLYFYHDDYLRKPHVEGIMKNYIGHTYFEYAYVK